MEVLVDEEVYLLLGLRFKSILLSDLLELLLHICNSIHIVSKLFALEAFSFGHLQFLTSFELFQFLKLALLLQSLEPIVRYRLRHAQLINLMPVTLHLFLGLLLDVSLDFF